jgi:hypothetical protein
VVEDFGSFGGAAVEAHAYPDGRCFVAHGLTRLSATEAAELGQALIYASNRAVSLVTEQALGGEK